MSWRCALLGHRWTVCLDPFIGPRWLVCTRCHRVDIEDR